MRQESRLPLFLNKFQSYTFTDVYTTACSQRDFVNWLAGLTPNLDEIDELVDTAIDTHNIPLLSATLRDMYGYPTNLGLTSRNPLAVLSGVDPATPLPDINGLAAAVLGAMGRSTVGYYQPRKEVTADVLDRLIDISGPRGLRHLFHRSGSDTGRWNHRLMGTQRVFFSSEAYDVAVERAPQYAIGLQGLSVSQMSKALLSLDFSLGGEIARGLSALHHYPSTDRQTLGRQLLEMVRQYSTPYGTHLPSLDISNAKTFLKTVSQRRTRDVLNVLSLFEPGTARLYLMGLLDDDIVPSVRAFDGVISLLNKDRGNWWVLCPTPNRCLPQPQMRACLDKIPGMAWRPDLFRAAELHVNWRLKTARCDEGLALRLFEDQRDAPPESQITLQAFCKTLNALGRATRQSSETPAAT
jgi:hypothetical protein